MRQVATAVKPPASGRPKVTRNAAIWDVFRHDAESLVHAGHRNSHS
jgi:hypothetical protein